MEWSQKRKIYYALSFAGVLIGLVAYPTYRLVYQAPSCFDQKQNGAETGVDCGGTCDRFCPTQIPAPRVVWAKAFSVGVNTYDLGAYVENPQKEAGIANLHYTMDMLDGAGGIIASGSGVTEVPPQSAFLLFVPRVSASSAPNSLRVTFDGNDLARWVRATTTPEVLLVKKQNLRSTDTTPRFDATLVNTDRINDVPRVVASAVIKDAQGEPVGISQSYVDGVSRGGEAPIFFSWPAPFTKNPKGGVCSTPVDTMLVLDKSSAMGRVSDATSLLNSARLLARGYLGTVSQTDQVGLITFDALPRVDQALSIDTSSIQGVLSGSLAPSVSPEINLGDALKAALAELSGDRHRVSAKSVAILFSSGATNRPNDPVNSKNVSYAADYAAGAADDLRRAGIEFYTVSFGGDAESAFLRNRIAKSDDTFFSARTTQDLQGLYQKISQTICKEENFIKEVVIMPRAVFGE